MKKILLTAIVLSIAAIPSFAKLSKYRDWPSTPQGYFMTAAERAEWAQLDTDEQAAKFIEHFLSIRGGDFANEVAKRTEIADKYLTLAKTKGSQTLRGKTIILLGPPAAPIDINDEVQGEGHRNAVSENIPRSSGAGADTSRGGAGMGTGDNISGSVTNLGTVHATRTYTFTFKNDITKKLDRKDLVVAVTADANTGRDRFAPQTPASEVEKAFELAAEASIVKPQS